MWLNRLLWRNLLLQQVFSIIPDGDVSFLQQTYGHLVPVPAMSVLVSMFRSPTCSGLSRPHSRAGDCVTVLVASVRFVGGPNQFHCDFCSELSGLKSRTVHMNMPCLSSAILCRRQTNPAAKLTGPSLCHHFQSLNVNGIYHKYNDKY
jgi:hypothetical protein